MLFGALLGAVIMTGIGLRVSHDTNVELEQMREQLTRERALADRIAAPAPSSSPVIFVSCPVCDSGVGDYDDTEMQMWQPYTVNQFLQMNENLHPKKKP